MAATIKDRAPRSTPGLLKAGSYSIAAGDPERVGFAGLSANAIATLPAASTCDGRRVTVSNFSSAYKVTAGTTGSDYIGTSGNGVDTYVVAPSSSVTFFAVGGYGIWQVEATNSATPDVVPWTSAPILLLAAVSATVAPAASVTTSALPDVPYAGSVPYGALIVVCAYWNSSSVTAALTDTNGNTWTPVYGSPITDGTNQCQMWYTTNGVAAGFISPSATFTVTFSGAVTATLVASAYSGCSGVLDASGSSAAGSGAGVISKFITTTAPQDLVVGFSHGNTIVPNPNGLTLYNAGNVVKQIGISAVPNAAVGLGFSQAAGASIHLLAAFKGATQQIPDLPVAATPSNYSTIAQGSTLTALACTNGVVEITGNGNLSSLSLSPVQGGLGVTLLYTGTGSTRIFDFTGGTLFQTLLPGQSVTLECDGTTWKVTGQNNGVVTAGIMYPAIVAAVDGASAALAAAVTSTLLYAVPAGQGGMYEIAYTLICTQQPTTSGTLGGSGAGFQAIFTDIDTNASSTPVANPTATQAAKPAVGAQISDAIFVNAKAATNINCQIGYTSSGATPMHFAWHAKVKYLGP